MKRLLTLLFFAFFAITTQAQTAPNLPPGSVPFGTGLFRAPDGDIWGGSKFDGYTNLGNWQRVADSLQVKINWSDTTIIASKEWVEGKLNSLPPSGVLTVTGDGVDNTDPANPVLSYPDPADIGALSPGDNVSDLTNDAGYLDSETDPVYSGDPASGITQNDIDGWDAKQDAITGAATTVVSSNLTPSRALISNGSGKIAVSPVSSTELAFLDGVSSNIQDQLDAKIPLAQKGASNGVAPIGSDGKIPGEYLPSSGSYKGTWDASTNTPTIADGVGTNGDRYRVSVGGTVDLGSGPITFVAGDDVIYNGTVWQRSPSGVTVTSVAGKTGDVVLDKNDVGLGNVDNTSDLDKPISTAVQNALDLKLDASEISNYYTKTQLQTSGQAQVHWGNVTNVPGMLRLGTGGSSVLETGSGIDISEVETSFATYVVNPEGGPVTNNGTLISFRRSDKVGAQFYIVNTSGSNLWWRSSENTWNRAATINDIPAAQTLSTAQGANNLTISGGNSVTLNNLYYKSASNFPDDLASLSSGFHPLNISSGTGWPSNFGFAIAAMRPSGASNNNGSFILFNSTTGIGKLSYSLGAGDSWGAFENIASESHVASNYVTLNTAQTITGEKTFRGIIRGGLQVSSTNGTTVLSDTYTGGISILNIGTQRGTGSPFIASGMTNKEGDVGWISTHSNNRVRSYLRLGASAIQGGLFFGVAEQQSTAVGNPITGLTEYEVWHSGNLDPSTITPETVISTTVNFTINWQTDIAPGSSGKTYAELHGNHFVYSAFYTDGSGSEVNYSPAVKITRNGSGAITTVQFGDIQTGNIVIK